jgi:hypothetical protein
VRVISQSRPRVILICGPPGEADKILVNSEFTSRVFSETFKSLPRPSVVYPGIDLHQYQGPADDDETIQALRS